ncbi:YtrH family sporulation protein [Aneurinibacillus sp. Ricciae_BoGa-3]|uniref:YtrH family sporulation protein n=1 Tax=Aneurinibacillus sp. Ricciae_BoGa-3 TaxID=3022697 RepID=UPI002340CD53|nr:YtrH family sporulation protein [Aneurinibacillus sp. Ricciae_BoGa-3]WCK55506.1 YtrH family sporulation protein [Aneurinibacillus sp. Ricciae_BoGa-3]
MIRIQILNLLNNMIGNFFIAFGIVLGGSLLGGLAAFIACQPPLAKIQDLSGLLKIWGLVGALNGTFDSFMKIEHIFSEGSISPVIKQLIFIISAFMGANTATLLIQWLVQGKS